MPSRWVIAALRSVPVLVVEDHGASARMLSALLTAAGAKVLAVDTAQAALTALETFPARVLIVDLVLPDADGLALVRTLKADAKTRHIACIAVTVMNDRDTERSAYEAGCVAYVAKPVDTDNFATLVAKQLEGMK